MSLNRTDAASSEKADWKVKEFIDAKTGRPYRLYWHKGKICKRVLLNSRLAEQLAGYSLIEKDLRSVSVWMTEINKLAAVELAQKPQRSTLTKDRERYDLVKGLFVAALTFYGKSFSKCEGRPVKLERAQLEEKFRARHDECMAFRHNFAAHSGAKRIETLEVVLVLSSKAKVAPRIFQEMNQPDMAWSKEGEETFLSLAEHARQIAVEKMALLRSKILLEEVLPKGFAYWNKL